MTDDLMELRAQYGARFTIYQLLPGTGAFVAYDTCRPRARAIVGRDAAEMAARLDGLLAVPAPRQGAR